MTLFNKIATSNIPQQITTTGFNVKNLTFFGFKSFTTGAPNNNTGPIYIGTNTNELPVQINSGNSYNWNTTNKENLSNFWVRGAANDGVYIVAY